MSTKTSRIAVNLTRAYNAGAPDNEHDFMDFMDALYNVARDAGIVVVANDYFQHGKGYTFIPEKEWDMANDGDNERRDHARMLFADYRRMADAE